MPSKTSDELIKSLYEVVLDTQSELRAFRDEMILKFDSVESNLENKIDTVGGYVSGHEGRISSLEDSVRVIKTKLGFR